MIKHCMSIDVEGFCEAIAESFPVSPSYVGSKKEKNEIEINVNFILDWLNNHNVKATFFILGVIAQKLPRLVRRIAEEGHEIGSHSFYHLRLFNLNESKLKEGILGSKKMLEDASGKSVYGFRAPEFSINAKSLKILDIIQEAGYLYDSSIYPIGGHDTYGVPGVKRDIHHLPNGLVEFPPPTLNLFGKVFPVLGGGYFRLLPYAVSEKILNRLTKKGRPTILYIHPYELGPECPKLKGMSLYRKFRHYVNMDKSKRRFSKLFNLYQFVPAIDILTENNYIANSLPK